MKKTFKLFLLTLLAMTFTTNAGAQIQGQAGRNQGVPLPKHVENYLNQSATHAPLVKLGTQVTQKKVNIMKAVYDYSKMGGNVYTTIVLRDAAGGSAVIPARSIITNVMADLYTAMTGAGASIGIGVNSENDLYSQMAITNFVPGVIGQGKATGATGTMIKVWGNSAVTARITGASITGGKINFFIEYLLSD